jgi:hypothetical protein
MAPIHPSYHPQAVVTFLTPQAPCKRTMCGLIYEALDQLQHIEPSHFPFTTL